MTLDNLIGKLLERIEPDSAAIQRLLEAAQRNITDYSGDLVEDAAVAECLIQARYLLQTVTAWLNSKH